MFSKFFIDRPIFASVLAILITIGGLVAMRALPIARFPEVVPPCVVVSASYPGADAATLASSVATPIEAQLSGARNLLYYQTTCTNDGNVSITVTFDIGTDQDMAAVDVQNRVNTAAPRLPAEVTKQGITVTKKSTELVLMPVLVADDPRYDALFLTNYATINLVDPLKRVPGVGDVQVAGGNYAMRVWLDPDRMAAKGITVADVQSAIQEQNGQYAAGRIGARPASGDQQLTISVTTRGRLEDAREFADIQVRTQASGAVVRIKDIARVELGSDYYDFTGRYDGKPTALIRIYLQTGANALAVAKGVREVLDGAQQRLPAGVSASIPLDTTRFIEVSIEEVVHTLFEAVVLVLLVVFLFLQSWRATLIPLLAVPVAVIGTFAGLLALGYTINLLTLFGMVLAIGIVVDDAIVVVENVERIMATTGKGPREATIQAMQEVTGPVVAIVLVLAAVFVPVAFMGGLTGRFYQQFAITIALSVAISGLVALTLSPALCRLLLKPHDHHAGQSRNPLALLFRGFNWSFDRLTAGYGRGVALLLRHAAIGVVIFAALGFATWKLFEKVPTGFIPAEDQGYVIVAIQLPPGSSLERTEQVMRRVEAWWQANPATDHVMALSGYSALNGINSTAGCTLFVTLKDWNERLGKPGQDVRSLLSGCWKEFGGDPAAIVIPINPSPVPGLGTRVGFEVQLQATAGQGLDELAAASDRLLAALRTRPEIDTPNMAFSVSDPQLRVDVDREQVKASGLALGDVFSTLQAQLGSLYVNDFVRFGRVWRVQIQADPAFRDDPARIGGMYIRNKQGEILPLASVVRHRWQAGPNFVSHFNSFAAATITGANAAGWSTGDAMRAVREEAAKLPSGFQLAWSGSSYQEIKAGSQAGPILAFGLLIVVLILMAQYESVRLPVAVLLAVPLGILGAMGACWLTGLPNNIYVQIGLLVLVGLAAKNAILIVEFAAEEVRQGRSVVEAAQNAARLRLRPILMTSLAFILGVLPLAMARGAGAAGRVSIGIAVLGGMIAATVLAVFLVPLFFRLVAKGPAAAPPAPADPPPPAEG